MFFKYELFLLKWLSLFRNWSHIRTSDGCFKTSIANVGKTVTILILYTFSKNLKKVRFLSRISRINKIILRQNLNISFIFWNAGLYSIENLTVIFVQVFNNSSTIVLPNHLDSDICQIITSSSNSAIDSTGFTSLILLAALLFLFRIALYLLIGFMYSLRFTFFSYMFIVICNHIT